MPVTTFTEVRQQMTAHFQNKGYDVRLIEQGRWESVLMQLNVDLDEPGISVAKKHELQSWMSWLVPDP